MADDEQHPSESAILTAYQVAAQWFATEEQLIWIRTGVFVGLNTLVAAALQFLIVLPGPARFVLAALGCIYAIGWHFSMLRLWNYDRYLVRLMREQEEALHLGRLGPFTRGRMIAEGHNDVVGGELTKFGPSTLIFRAKVLADATTWLFFLAYVAFAAREVLRIAP